MAEAGQQPIVMRREIDGFVVNRLQGALLHEAFRLVADGYAGVEDVDTCIRDGLALRWAFMGPFETIDLNAPAGVRDYAERYEGMYAEMFESMTRRVPWSGATLDRVEAQRREHLPADGLAQRQIWRDLRLMELAAHKERLRQGGAALNPIPFPIVDSPSRRPPARASSSLEQKHVPGKVIITCAITGAIHTPSMSPHLPIQPEHIAREAIAAAEAGAAILHLHARNPENGKPDQTPEAFARFLPQVKQGTNAVINITSGGSPYMRVEERVRPAAQFKPEVASLNMGSINFGLYHLLNKYTEFQFEWEREHLEATRDLIFRNSFKDIEYILSTCYDNGTRFEFECYDIAHLYNLAHFADRGLVKAPFFVQSVFGLLGGIGTHPEDVIHMRRTADRLFGKDYRWSVLGAGASQFRIAAQSAAMGGNVRVGLEDSLWAGKGRLAQSNAEQVRSVRQIIEGLGLQIATPEDARRILQLWRRPGGVLNQRRQACASRFWPTSRPRWAKGPCGTWTSSGCTGSTVSTAGIPLHRRRPRAARLGRAAEDRFQMALRKQAGGGVAGARLSLPGFS